MAAIEARARGLDVGPGRPSGVASQHATLVAQLAQGLDAVTRLLTTYNDPPAAAGVPDGH